jgi:hypothetical protein
MLFRFTQTVHLAQPTCRSPVIFSAHAFPPSLALIQSLQIITHARAPAHSQELSAAASRGRLRPAAHVQGRHWRAMDRFLSALVAVSPLVVRAYPRLSAQVCTLEATSINMVAIIVVSSFYLSLRHRHKRPGASFSTLQLIGSALLPQPLASWTSSCCCSNLLPL